LVPATYHKADILHKQQTPYHSQLHMNGGTIKYISYTGMTKKVSCYLL